MSDIDIKDLLLSVTNFCLGDCKYCALKSLKSFNCDDETNVKNIERLLIDPLLAGLEGIHVTGGEPILSPKTYEIFKLLHKHHPNIRVNMPVSGFFPYTTYQYCKRLLNLMPQLRVDISVDGPSKIHELTRGENTWGPVTKTISMLRSIENFNLQLQITVNKFNYEYINFVQDMAEDFGFGFYITFPHFGTRFGHKKDEVMKMPQNIIDKIDEQIRSRWCKKRSLNMRIWKLQKALWEGNPIYMECYQGRDSIDIDPYGFCYPCMVYRKDQIFGNIKEKTLTEIFQCNHVKKILGSIKDKKCQPCLMPCCLGKIGGKNEILV